MSLAQRSSWASCNRSTPRPRISLAVAFSLLAESLSSSPPPDQRVSRPARFAFVPGCTRSVLRTRSRLFTSVSSESPRRRPSSSMTSSPVVRQSTTDECTADAWMSITHPSAPVRSSRFEACSQSRDDGRRRQGWRHRGLISQEYREVRTSTCSAATSPDPGWLFFAGTVLGLAGLMRLVDAFWAFRYNGALPDGLQDGALGSNLDNYAWTWLVVGIILIVASLMLMTRSQLARWIGYIAAGLGALSAITWMPYYPIWAMTYVLIALLVFYALAQYGGRNA